MIVSSMEQWPRHCMLVALVAGIAVAVLPASAEGNDPQAMQRDANVVEGLVGSYCLDCHNSFDPAGGFDLESFDFSPVQFTRADFDSQHWEKMVRRLTGRQMPPPDAERPSDAEYQHSIQALANLLDEAAEAHPKPGRSDSIRRLNRTEYQNAIRDLLAVDVDVASLLPADESSHGFDNITVGELSPTLLSRYLSAGQKISRLAVGRGEQSPGGVTVRLPADRTQESHVEGLPLGTRGGTLIKHTFPQDGQYDIELRLTRDRDEKVEGLDQPHEIDVLIDRQRVHQFTVRPPPGRQDYTHVDSHLKTRIDVTAGPHEVGVTFPQKFSSLLETKRQPFDARYNRHRHPRLTPALFQVSIVGPFSPQGPGDTPSRRRIFTCYPEQKSGPSTVIRGTTLKHENGTGTEPLEAEYSRQSNLSGSEPVPFSPADEQLVCAELMRRAYRRPITDADLESPLWFFEEGLREGGFEAGIEAALTSILVNPNFLFRIEEDPADVKPGESYRISDVELASRLSFFLWSSIPDDQLLELAEQGVLHEQDVLESQVERMLADERANSLVTNFAAQWLYLRNLDSITPDLRLFPDFDDNLRQAFRRETELMFADIMRSDRSVLGLIRSDYTFLNERLARHYGIPHVFGSHFRRVELDAASHRGGLLRQGSILTVTSYATRTSPTIRGNWILENILGTPPPPPPPNVPNLQEKTTLVATSVRERLAQHRANPTCASCHDRMDPVGFALENFDAVGRWRDFEDSLVIDASGALPDGSKVDGVDALEAGILARPEMFAGTLTEKLMTFALGRGLEPYDGPAVRKIISDAAREDYRFSSIVLGIALSKPFQMRSAE